MGRQSVVLTDQALVAVALARRVADARGGTPTVADLLAGLAAEPDGRAGHQLRAHGSAAAELTTRTVAPPPNLAPLDAALVRAAGAAAPRPAATRDLLTAAVAAGGDELRDLLESVGYDVDALTRARGDAVPELTGEWGSAWGPHSETYGYAADASPALTTAAARAVAQVRALAGGAVDLVLALASAPDNDDEALDPQLLGLVLARLHDEGAPHAAGAAWDHGLDAVVEAARRWRRDGIISAADLLAAATLAGGTGPRRLLEEARE
jgi:hypothetical protein